MPITECAACGKMMSTQSKRCPHCGYESRKPSVLGLKLLIVLIVASGFGTYAALRRSPQGRAALQSMTDFARSEVGVAPKTVDAEVPIVVDVPAIAGKSSKEVTALLGPPFKRETVTIHGKGFPASFYRNGQVQVVFVNGKADWITIFHLGALPFTPQALKGLGFPVVDPAVSAADVMRWQDMHGVRELSFFPQSNGTTDYASVFVQTEP